MMKNAIRQMYLVVSPKDYKGSSFAKPFLDLPSGTCKTDSPRFPVETGPRHNASPSTDRSEDSRERSCHSWTWQSSWQRTQHAQHPRKCLEHEICNRFLGACKRIGCFARKNKSELKCPTSICKCRSFFTTCLRHFAAEPSLCVS